MVNTTKRLYHYLNIAFQLVWGIGMYAVKFAISAATAIVIGVGAVQAADLLTKEPAISGAGPWGQLWAGADVAPDSTFGYAGAVFAFNNHNLNQDGWLFRVSGGGGDYRYNLAPGVSQGVDFEAGDITVGYQTFIGQTRLTGYLGGYIENDANPDPLATVKGTRAGVKVQGEIFTPFMPNWYAFLLGSYTSAWNNFLLIGRLGDQITPAVSVGPEVMGLGNDRYDEVRAGGFLSFNVTTLTQFIVSAGYNWDTRANSLNDHSGGYATVHMRSAF